MIPNFEIRHGFMCGKDLKPIISVKIPVGVGSNFKTFARAASHLPDAGGNFGSYEPSLGTWAKRLKYMGKVLYNGEVNGYHDSDFYVNVWDDETESIKRVMIGTTRGPAGEDNHYGPWPVDATPEVWAKARAYEKRVSEDWSIRKYLRRETPYRGEVVKVTAKRAKVKFSTEGEVFWTGSGAYGPRVGFRTLEGEKHFTALSNVGFTIDPKELFDSYGKERVEAIIEGLSPREKARIKGYTPALVGAP